MMPDITMCARTDCPKSRNCLRHADSGTVASFYQSYAKIGGENPEECLWFSDKNWGWPETEGERNDRH